MTIGLFVVLALKLFRGWQVDSPLKAASSSRQLVFGLAAPEALRHWTKPLSRQGAAARGR